MEKKDATMCFTISKALKEKAIKKANEMGISVSSYIRMLLIEGLKKDGNN